MNTVAVLVTVHVVAGQAILQQTNRNENDITLKCLDKNEEPILNATFHRNGATLADDPCFSADNIVASSDGSAIAITVSPPCEGYFMCSEEKRVIVSLPIAIYAYPVRMSQQQTMTVMEGSNITLPCRVQRPYINSYTIEWIKHSESVITLPSGQFDLELINVSLTQSGNYICKVQTSIDQPEEGADATAGTITLNVVELYSPPTIVADVEVQEVDKGYYRFIVIASGSSPLSYTWHINDTIPNTCRSYVSCTLSMDSFGGGHTKIQVQVANNDRMGMRHSANSTLIILLGGVGAMDTCMHTCTTDNENVTSLVIGLGVMGVALLIATVIILICWYQIHHPNKRYKRESLEDITRIIRKTLEQMDDCKINCDKV